jgi:aspartate dehydrogenase
LRIGLIGNGAIARALSAFCAERPRALDVVGALVLRGEASAIGAHPLTTSLAQLLAAGPQLIVECAGHAAVAAHSATILDSGVDLIIASTGSLADELLLASIRGALRNSSARVRLPAGAVPGIDALSAARLAGLSAVSLQSSKPPSAWRGSPAEAACQLDALETPTVIFQGSARQAAIAFPKNANVAATVALAGLGFEHTRVRLVADPMLSQNVHRVEAQGTFGEMTLEVRARPMPDNPKTSHLAALSIMRLLENETAGIAI